ncbi:MAG: hypothetical protein CM15mV102_140 [uncultured marine virus]|nr:MAG: hypothetical protein CM15mV102_140 [uncultured marine virus]
MRSTEMVDGELQYVPDGRYYLTRANGTVVVEMTVKIDLLINY